MPRGSVDEKKPHGLAAEGVQPQGARVSNDSGVRGGSSSASPLPAVTLPKGGGAIRGIGEKFAANPVTGTGSFTVPIAVSPGRSGFGPQLSLSYDSGGSNGPFGWGFSLSLPSITRKTDKGLPQYRDEDESDTFILSGAEDLVPVLQGDARHRETRTVDGKTYLIRRYRPRIEGLFARIERWTEMATATSHWRSISKDNITTFYGKSEGARIADPTDKTRVFSWLIEESRDDKGNVISYVYRPEDAAKVDASTPQEQNRLRLNIGFTNRYIKQIRYGNRVPFEGDGWLFEVVFDYGDHDKDVPSVKEDRLWDLRADPFSSYRAGFEVRTYRLCQRVLMFHNFPELGPESTLVRSTDLRHSNSPIASFVEQITQRGYRRSGTGPAYTQRAFPPVELAYTKARIDQTVQEIDPASLENMPQGLGGEYHWVDLYNEGLSGILTDQAGAWFYKPNRGAGTFGPVQLVAQRPAIGDLDRGRAQILDIDADGRNDLVQFQRPVSGFHRQQADGSWAPFIPFLQVPTLDWNDPNLRFVDLTGDGQADILITEDQVFTWYPSGGRQGFSPSERVYTALDEERGPKLVFTSGSDGTEAIYLADMSGDGLVDLVRIRNGEVCYWPNLGYGRFGARVTMGGSPHFDRPDQFSQKRLRLADIDGSGAIDILYLGPDRVSIYFNQSGNSFSEPQILADLPSIDGTVNVTVVDLLGNGTACLVFSSPLPGDARRSLRYVDLMGGQKPHLLERVINNLGAETHVRYASSTSSYLADLRAGRPWLTRLPFPVHVIERVEVYDAISQNRFVSRYEYHHGYYDGVEREFRGFGAVDQWDTESFAALQKDGILPPASNDSDPASHVPPVRTRTWFHSGTYKEGSAISQHLALEYYRTPGQSESGFQALLLPDTILPAGLSADEEREACRALKGAILRQEVYTEDGSDRAGVPYTVSERNYTVESLQLQGANRHAVFFVHPRETLGYHYEREPDDPRVGHELVIAVDEFGNVLRSATIGYGRKAPSDDKTLEPRDHAKQGQLLATCAENQYTNSVNEPDRHRTPLPCEVRSYELMGLSGGGGQRLPFDEVAQAVQGAVPLSYEERPSGGLLKKRLIEQERTLYRKDDLTAPLELGRLESLALPYKSFKLAFTPGLLEEAYGGRVIDAMLEEGGYVRFPGDDRWWIPSGRIFYSPSDSDSAPAELEHARKHFYLPHCARDAFQHTSTVAYDGYDLLPRQARDPVGNLILAEADYRALQLRRVNDPNHNRTWTDFDELGMVIATAVMGKEGKGEGDTEDDPTTRLEYDLFAWIDRRAPALVHAFAREQHGSANPRWQESYSYSDGFGREIQKKIQAEPGPLVKGGPVVNPRWVGSGWTVFNNKGKPVRQYEPFFSAAYDFEFARVVGVSSIPFYDPVERVVATLHPNHTYEKVAFDPWRQETWDVNDTLGVVDNPLVVANPRDDAHVGAFFARLADTEYLPTWYVQRLGGALGAQEQAAAKKAAAHAGTPARAHFDSLGRTFLTIADNGADGKYATRVELDIEGNQREVWDAKDRLVMRYDYDMLSTRIHQANMEAGERWMLNDVAGKPIYGWDSRQHVLRTSYDPLRRPTEVHLREGRAAEILVGRTIYGEGQPDSETSNLRGQAYQVFDGAGVVTNEAYDFKGNLLRSSRQLAVEYKKTLDWSAEVPLEAPRYTSSTTYDALNRPVTQTTPDQSVLRPTYNEANLLERINGSLRGTVAVTVFVSNFDYDAKGRCLLIEYGNGIKTSYIYDPLTFRLKQLATVRGGDRLQDLQYTYDPAGNITYIRDTAQQTIYFRNQRVGPGNDYTYDAIYRLIAATGREHLGQVNGGPAPPTVPGPTDSPRVGLLHPGDGNAMGRYLQKYVYDQVGNILSMSHRGTDPANPGWTRAYAYNEASLLESSQRSNRLSSTKVGSATEPYSYDAHGNMTAMAHLPLMEWDYKGELQATVRQVVTGGGTPETTYYVYDAGGERVRKVTDRVGGKRKVERIYLGRFEIHREYGSNGGTVVLERESLHVIDDKQRVAMVETRTQGTDPAPVQLVRYQFGNHLCSAMLELDGNGQTISYEEYYPFGSTSYQSSPKQTETPKRYRYTGKERDDESGLYYHRARYHATWLGRWTSCDPMDLKEGTNLYVYVSNNPLSFVDINGQEKSWWDKKTDWLKGAATQAVSGTIDAAKSQLLGSIPIYGDLYKMENYQNTTNEVYNQFRIYRAGPVGETVPSAVVHALNDTLNPLAHAKSASNKAERAERVGDYVAVGQENVKEVKALVEFAMIVAGMASAATALTASRTPTIVQGSSGLKSTAADASSTTSAGSGFGSLEASTPRPGFPQPGSTAPTAPMPKLPATGQGSLPLPSQNNSLPMLSSQEILANRAWLENITTGLRYLPTQNKIYRGTVESMAASMKIDKFPWGEAHRLDPIILDKNLNIQAGHHRILASWSANINIPKEYLLIRPELGRVPRPWSNVAVKSGPQ